MTPFACWMALPVALFCLAACGHAPAKPEPTVITRDVMVPVAKACVPPNLPPEPDWRVTGDTIRRAPTPEDRMQQLAIGFKERDDRRAQAEPVIRACR